VASALRTSGGRTAAALRNRPFDPRKFGLAASGPERPVPAAQVLITPSFRNGDGIQSKRLDQRVRVGREHDNDSLPCPGY
jgi:hypothetical protein